MGGTDLTGQTAHRAYQAIIVWWKKSIKMPDKSEFFCFYRDFFTFWMVYFTAMASISTLAALGSAAT